MRAVVLIAGQTFPSLAERRGDFPEWIRARTKDAWPGEWRSHDLRGDDPLPLPRDADAFIITGSSSSVTEEAPWMQRANELVRAIVVAEVPLLGLCFGHQMIAHALGGLVEKNPRGREIGTVRARRLCPDPLLDELPATFHVHTTHVDSVTRLPHEATLLAETDKEPIAAFRLGKKTWAVQFHPEFDADVMRTYLRERADLVRGEGGDPVHLLKGVREVRSGDVILRAFATFAREDARRAG
jgi:GMP synthase (glutamine-hydrolysing)